MWTRAPARSSSRPRARACLLAHEEQRRAEGGSRGGEEGACPFRQRAKTRQNVKLGKAHICEMWKEGVKGGRPLQLVFFSHEAKAAAALSRSLTRPSSAALVGLPFHLVGKRQTENELRRVSREGGREVIRLPGQNERGKRTAAIERNLCGGRGKFLSNVK